MRRSLRHLRPGLAHLLAWAAAVVLFPGPASPRVLELVEQHADTDIYLPLALTFSHDGRYLYVGGLSTVIFERDDATGELGFVNATDGALAMALSPDGRNLYAHIFGALRVFTRDPEDPVPSFLEIWAGGGDGIHGFTPEAVTVSPDGRHVYVATTEATLVVFACDRRTGALRHVATYFDGFDGISGLDGVHHVALSADGAHLYAASSPWNGGQATVAVFERDANSGGLSFVDAVADGSGGAALGGARFLLLSPDGRHVYVAAAAGVLTFARDSGTGALSFAGIHDGRADSIAISPEGDHLYAVNESDAVVTVLARDAGFGTLSFVEAFSDGIAGYRGFDAVAVAPDGRHLYVASHDDATVAAFTRDAGSGTLDFVAAYSGDVEGDADGIDGATQVVASPDGRHVYVASQNGDVAALSRSATTGELEYLAVYDESDGFLGLHAAVSIAASPDGRQLYVASSQPDNALAVLTRHEATGELDFLEAHFDGVGGVEGLSRASSVEVSPDGRNVYVAGRSDDAVAAFSRDPATGELTFDQAYVDGTGGIDGLTRVRSLALSPGGEHLYAVSFTDESLAAFARDATTGELQYLEAHFEGVDGVTALAGVYDVTVSPDGRHVYAMGNSGIAAFQRDPASGRLAFLEAGSSGTTFAYELEVSPDGEYVYVFGNEIAVLSRQAATGALRLLEIETLPQYFNYRGPNGTQSPDGRHLYVAARQNDFAGLVALRRSDGPCMPTPSSLCVNGNRFRFELDWRDHSGNTGTAQAVPQGTDLSGVLYFRNPDNWELQVKVIDACSYNDRFWVFAAASTDLEYTLRVTDELAGVTKTYFNPLGNAAAAITDTGAFATCGSARPPAGRFPTDRSPWESPSRGLDPAALIAGVTAGAGSEPLPTAAVSDSGAGTALRKGGELPYLLVGLGGKCLDVEGGGTAAGTPVSIFDCHWQANQRWVFHRFCDIILGCSEGFEIRGHGGNCLQPGAQTPAGRTPLVMGPCGGQEDLWTYSGVYPERLRLVHLESGGCADVQGGGTADGTPVNLHECHDGANQVWRYHETRCFRNPTLRCLNENRFEVEIEWRDFAGKSGVGRVVPHGSPDSGLFWFFWPWNWEMLVKVLDGCALNGHHWVFAAATTNVEYTLRVTDTRTGQVREYFNPAGRSAPAITDTSAFPTCP